AIPRPLRTAECPADPKTCWPMCGVVDEQLEPARYWFCVRSHRVVQEKPPALLGQDVWIHPGSQYDNRPENLLRYRFQADANRGTAARVPPPPYPAARAHGKGRVVSYSYLHSVCK